MLTFNKNTPVLFLVFNRPHVTKKVFAEIKKAQPERLYIAADGPRDENERQVCEETRNIAINVDWDCTVIKLFRQNNLGCKQAISEAITWFFEKEEYGIILEDDCLPSQSFFGFCSQLLMRYKDDERIGHIAGINFQQGNPRGDGSYYFSRLTHVWGWAGWRRIWKDYDQNISTFHAFAQSRNIYNSESHASFAAYWLDAFSKVFSNEINTWDYQYAYLNLINNRLCIIPNKNLVSNIGVGENATHTAAHPFQNLPLDEIVSLQHPAFFIANLEADIYSQKVEYNIIDQPDRQSFLKKINRFFYG